MPTPHKHAEVIKAWTDGKTIQLLQDDGQWVDLDTQHNNPGWLPAFQYRVKPETIVRFVPVDVRPDGRPYLGLSCDDLKCARQRAGPYATGILCIELPYDGRALLSARMERP